MALFLHGLQSLNENCQFAYAFDSRDVMVQFGSVFERFFANQNPNQFADWPYELNLNQTITWTEPNHELVLMWFGSGLNQFFVRVYVD